MKLELWIYRLLLQAYPKDFRLDFGEEMLQVFRLEHKAAKLEKRMLSFWFCTVKDIVFGAIREHIQKQRKPNMITINRFDEGARLAFHFARAEAVLLEHSLIEPEHIFLGLVRQNDHVRKVLERLGRNLEFFRVRLQTTNAKDHFERVPQITKRTRFTMEQSAKEAKNLGANHVDSRHIMLGLMADQKGMVYNWLSELADPNEIRDQILSA
jgi:Clp amino terminal domain, pathogenicity island component